MSMRQAERQMPASAGRVAVAGGEAVRATISDEACSPRHEIGNAGSALLLAALTRENLQHALKRVRANKGAAGVDGLDINQTAQHLVTAWPEIREQLLQVLQPILDPAFSQYSFGFRPGRCAQHAVRIARSYVQSGRRIVVESIWRNSLIELTTTY